VELTQEALEAAYCWEAEDRVPGRPAMTELRRRLRFHQGQWREAKRHPIGSQPIAPRPGQSARPVGSRLPLDYARETGANFVTAGARTAAVARTSVTEPNQSFDHQRFWADLLWSPAAAVNLFGDLAADPALADRAVHAWWPDVPGAVSAVRFTHSPGWLDPAYLNSLRAFDAAFVLDLEDGTYAIVGVDIKYHERAKTEIARPENLPRYLGVAERSGAFLPGATGAVEGKNDLAVMWLEHLLLLSMLQHPSGTWSWGRYVVVHPEDNEDVGGMCARYRALLAETSTYACMTLEELLGADALPARTTTVLRERYLLDEL
jgi:PD-(D/E)XK nuclease superfamily